MREVNIFLCLSFIWVRFIGSHIRDGQLPGANTMATNYIEKMKKRGSARAGSLAGRASRYTKWLMIAVLAAMAFGIGLHIAGLLPPGMARFTYAAQ